MKTKANQNQQNQVAANSLITTYDGFNFDLWARAVKQQMLAALREKAGG